MKTGDVRRAQFELYSTSACHLCEQAAAMIAAWRENGLAPQVVEVDIAEDDILFERYGVRIPVLRRGDGEELGWPFTIEALGEFLAGGQPSGSD